MQGTYTHIPETNYVPKEHGVAAILLFLFMVLISLLAVLNLLYFYISTFQSMCAVPIIIIIIIIILHFVFKRLTNNLEFLYKFSYTKSPLSVQWRPLCYTRTDGNYEGNERFS